MSDEVDTMLAFIARSSESVAELSASVSTLYLSVETLSDGVGVLSQAAEMAVAQGGVTLAME